MIIGENNLILTAHPDDETLWAGGLVASFQSKRWTCICLSTPRRKDEANRALEFFAACKVLGVKAIQESRVESEPSNDLVITLQKSDIEHYDCVITHGPKGEYGHRHHKNVNAWAKQNISVPGYTFGYGSGSFKLELTPESYDLKIMALHEYKTHMTAMPKWKALMERYPICCAKEETFNEL